MAKNPIEKVEIVEPPIGDFTKKRFTWRRSCFTSCASIVIFLVLVFIGIHLYIGRGPSKFKSLPPYFPNTIPLYDKDNVESIVAISGKYKTRGVALSAFFPRLLLSPLFFTVQNSSGVTESEPAGPIEILATPVTDNRTTVRIEWRNLDAEATFVTTYYKTELRKAGYQISNEKNSFQEKSFDFVNGEIDGSFYIHADPGNRTGSDFASLVVHIPVNP